MKEENTEFTKEDLEISTFKAEDYLTTPEEWAEYKKALIKEGLVDEAVVIESELKQKTPLTK